MVVRKVTTEELTIQSNLFDRMVSLDSPLHPHRNSAVISNSRHSPPATAATTSPISTTASSSSSQLLIFSLHRHRRSRTCLRPPPLTAVFRPSLPVYPFIVFSLSFLYEFLPLVLVTRFVLLECTIINLVLTHVKLILSKEDDKVSMDFSMKIKTQFDMDEVACGFRHPERTKKDGETRRLLCYGWRYQPRASSSDLNGAIMASPSDFKRAYAAMASPF
nr:hypothetical protein Iba_chr14bCG10680 [Ipomoea batatas]